MASSSYPCAACKFLHLNCTQQCVFAPYFPADQPHVRNVFEMFGASNVAKMLDRVSPEQRKYVANSLVYEAHMRLIDPLYGCVGKILELKQAISQKRHLLEVRRRMLAAKVGPAAAAAAFAAAAANAAAVAAAVAADAADGDAAAAVLLGLNVPNVFVPPPPSYHHPQQQQAYNYMGGAVQWGAASGEDGMQMGVQMGGAVQWGAASGKDGMQMGDAVQMEDGVQIEDRVQWGAASGVQMEDGVHPQGGAASGAQMEDGVQMGVGAVCASDADEATAAACSGIAAACSGRKGSEITEQKENVRN